MRRTRLRIEQNEINVTPLLDVVFIMLIFFIVTASFVKERAIDLSRSGSPTAQVASKGNILVMIDANGGIWVNRRPVTPGALQAYIRQLRAEEPQAKVIVKADEESPNGLLVRVLDASRLAGIADVSLAAER